MPKTRSPGPSAVAQQQDETKPAEASPPHAHEVRGRREAAPHARGSLRGLRREAARPPSPAPPGQGPARPGGARRPLRSHGLSRSGAAPRERRGRYSHIQARATARLGHRPAAGSPSGGSDPAASPDPRSPPDRRRGTRLRRRWRVPLLPPGRPTSPLPAGARRPAAGQEQRRAAAAALPGREGKGRGGGRARPRHPGAALHTAGCPRRRRRSCSCPGDVAVRADALITGRQAAAAAATAAAAGRGRPREGRAPRGGAAAPRRHLGGGSRAAGGATRGAAPARPSCCALNPQQIYLSHDGTSTAGKSCCRCHPRLRCDAGATTGEDLGHLNMLEGTHRYSGQPQALKDPVKSEPWGRDIA
ncbi:uncharacterized protein [Ciconia boyciana]|uniref:uncharacterized protein n=1 Tax=Ciconia boyciana TaxID=52775 RepID=UPI003B9F8EC4